jgi:prophage regulatory protein
MRVLRLPAVIEKVGLSRSTIYKGVADGTFPKPIKLGPKSVAWPDHELDALLAKRIAERDAQAA